MHKMKMIMEKLEEYVWEELEKDKEEICAEELAEIIDSIKDCTETMYYYKLYESMKDDSGYNPKNWHYKEKDIEAYIEYLFKEIDELMSKATPEEKEMLKKKMAEVHPKIN